MKYDPVAAAKGKHKPSQSKSRKGARDPEWKKKHNDFIEGIRAAKQIDRMIKEGKPLNNLPPPKASENSHYQACPHCSRRFAPDVAEKHIPKCANAFNRPKAPPSHNRYANGGGRMVGAGMGGRVPGSTPPPPQHGFRSNNYSPSPSPQSMKQAPSRNPDRHQPTNRASDRNDRTPDRGRDRTPEPRGSGGDGKVQGRGRPRSSQGTHLRPQDISGNGWGY